MLRNYFLGPKSASKYSEEMNTLTTRSLLEKKTWAISCHHSLFQSSSTIGTANAQSFVIAGSCSRLLFHLCMHWLRTSTNPLLPTGHPRSCAQSSSLFHSPQRNPASNRYNVVDHRGRVIFSVDTSFVCLKFRSGHYATCNRTSGIDFGHHFITSTNITCKIIREGFLEIKIINKLIK